MTGSTSLSYLPKSTGGSAKMKLQSVKLNIDSGEKTYLTPPYILEALGHFDVDPCCPENMPWKTADRMITPKENGLKQDWGGGENMVKRAIW